MAIDRNGKNCTLEGTGRKPFSTFPVAGLPGRGVCITWARDMKIFRFNPGFGVFIKVSMCGSGGLCTHYDASLSPFNTH